MGQDLSNPFISPQNARFANFPPTLIHVGALEALLDDSRVLAQKISAEGASGKLKVFPGMWHVWQVFGGLFKEADQSLYELGEFLNARLNG